MKLKKMTSIKDSRIVACRKTNPGCHSDASAAQTA